MRLNAPWYWYDFYAKPELQLLTSYIKAIESQIAAGIAHYEGNRKSELVVLSEEEGIAEEIEHYAGLESMSWNLDDVFKGYFPNLQRKSAFITLYAFLEHEVEQLSYRLRLESKLTVEPGDLAGQGVFRSLSYMEKVIVLNIDKSMAWNKVKGLNKLRNLIVHNDGKLAALENERLSDIKVLKQLRPHVEFLDDGISIKPTFLPHTLKLFDELFQYLDEAIGIKYKSRRNKATLFSKIKLKGKNAGKTN